MKPTNISKLSRSRPPIRRSGFTLIELLVTMAIGVILLGIGVPSFRSFVASQRVQSASSDVSSMLIRARSEAIKRNANVEIKQATGGWQNGWVVSITSGGTTTTLVEHEAFPSALTVANAATSLTYDGNGRTGTAAQFTVQSTPATRCATITVTVSGMPNSKTKNGSC